jgi:hypothetical protein
VCDEVGTGKLVVFFQINIPTGDLSWFFLPAGGIGKPLGIFADWMVRKALAESSTPD